MQRNARQKHMFTSNFRELTRIHQGIMAGVTDQSDRVLRRRTPKIGWRYASVFGDMCLGSDAYHRVYHGEISRLAKCVLQLKHRLKVCISPLSLSLSHTNPGLPPASSIFSFIPLGLLLLSFYVSLTLLFSLSFSLFSLSLVLTADSIFFTFYLSSRISAHIFAPPPLLLFLVPLAIYPPPLLLLSLSLSLSPLPLQN